MSNGNDSQQQPAPEPQPQPERRPTFTPEYDQIKESKQPKVYGGTQDGNRRG